MKKSSSSLSFSEHSLLSFESAVYMWSLFERDKLVSGASWLWNWRRVTMPQIFVLILSVVHVILLINLPKITVLLFYWKKRSDGGDHKGFCLNCFPYFKVCPQFRRSLSRRNTYISWYMCYSASAGNIYSSKLHITASRLVVMIHSWIFGSLLVF